MGLDAATTEAAYLAACHAELGALKPGNVHRFAGGHGMDVAVFEASAAVSAPEIAAPRRPVGLRVLRAVEATRAAVGMNTNLGILLLAAPLAAAAEAAGPAKEGAATPEGRLRLGVAEALAALTAADAEAVFQAIAHASPGGLGTRAAHDVRDPPRIGLIAAMRLAAPRDLVARQYAEGFAGVFEVGLPALRRARAAGAEGMWPAIHCFLAFAGGFPDSHVSRKFGDEAAEALRARMAETHKFLDRLGNLEGGRATLMELDRELKAAGLNPGTSADLTVASIFAEGLARQLEDWGRE